MMEYIFFDANMRDKFVEYATGLGVACDSRDDNMGLVVAVPEDLDDDLEARYDGLKDEQSELMSQMEGGLREIAGFKLALPDGQTRMVPLQPAMLTACLPASASKKYKCCSTRLHAARSIRRTVICAKS